MFFLYQHHDMARLAELQAVLLARRERAHALEPDTILVPNHGVGRWLQMRLAESEGIAANLQWPLPARFIWNLLPRLDPGAGDSRDFERERLRWHIYALLPALADEVPGIRAYLRTEPAAVQRLQLAERLADVFDQYLVFRPRMLDGWQAGRIDEAPPADWQARVWQALCRRLGPVHRGRRLHRFIADTPTRAALQAAGAPATLYCFGLGALPPDYLRFLYALARRIDVHFLLPNPGAGYWGDIERLSLTAPPAELPQETSLEQAHPLLASLGRGTRDLLRVLYADELQEIIEPELGEALEPQPPGEHSLLARVQSDVIALQAREECTDDAADVSVQVHACHGPLREVQVLHDQLLDLLGRMPDLQPRDILVMAPDIGRYAAAVEGVFGAARGARYLPYRLSDRSRESQHPILQSVQQLLALPLSRWTASEVMALARVPAVMRRFGLDEPALQQARDWIGQAGVRWGLDASTRRSFGAGGSAQYSWAFGLDRLLLGTMQSDEDTLAGGVAPWSDLEGSATAELGRFWYLLQGLRHWAATLAEPAGAAPWQQRLNAMLDELFEPAGAEPAELAALDELREAIAGLDTAAACLGDEALAWEAVRELLGQALRASGERQPFLSGGITFCGLQPLRAVPFRVVCVLGLDDGAFPRQAPHPGFNVLRQQPRLGDRDLRDDDRLLFLQALMAARDVFYLSYTGQDLSSGESLPPAPLLGEWLDFLHRHHFQGLGRADFEARVLTRQPMHPFSERLFRRGAADGRVFTFAAEWLAAGQDDREAAPAFADAGRLDAEPPQTIELDELRRFLLDPGRDFLRDTLQLDLRTPDLAMEDSEPLDLDKLQQWQLRDALLAHAQAHGDDLPATPGALWRQRALLPPAPLDRAAYADAAGQINALLPQWRRWQDEGPPGWRDIDLELDGCRLSGRIGGLWPDGLRRLRVGSLGAKHRLRAWIDLLACSAAGQGERLQLLGLQDGQPQTCTARIAPEAARDTLRTLLTLYREGQVEPLLFLPSLAGRYLEELDKGRTPQAALEKLNATLTDNHRPPFERDNPYFVKLLQPDTPLGARPGDTRFCELAEAIYGPPHRNFQEAAP